MKEKILAWLLLLLFIIVSAGLLYSTGGLAGMIVGLGILGIVLTVAILSTRL